MWHVNFKRVCGASASELASVVLTSGIAWLSLGLTTLAWGCFVVLDCSVGLLARIPMSYPRSRSYVYASVTLWNVCLVARGHDLSSRPGSLAPQHKHQQKLTLIFFNMVSIYLFVENHDRERYV
jgi:hypothetical protein